MVFVVYGQERIKGGRMRDMHHPPAIIKNVYDEYKVSIILNLFDNDKLYALSTHNRECANKMHNYLALGSKNFKKFA